ncbi:MAG: PD-(D/E)XK nuclease family protein [Bacteroidales bacterium]|nr:PD-(D/E)XK nuclease family protein [Bacteroidales bacterium]
MKDDLDSCVTLEKVKLEVDTAVLSDFENRLKALISDILNKDIPFEQSVSKKCAYCPYARICGIE